MLKEAAKAAKQLLMRAPEKYGRRACGHLGCEQLLAAQRLRTSIAEVATERRDLQSTIEEAGLVKALKAAKRKRDEVVWPERRRQARVPHGARVAHDC